MKRKGKKQGTGSIQVTNMLYPVRADSEGLNGDSLPHSLTNRASAPSRHLNSTAV